MWHVFDFSWKIVVIIVQSELKLYDLTVADAGVEIKLNKFVIRSHNRAIMCLFDRTEDGINILTWTIISMQLTAWSKATEVRDMLTILTQTTKRSCSHLRGRGRNGKNNTQTPEKTIQLILRGIRFVSEHLQPLKNRATRSAGKPVSILRDTAKTCRSFW